MRGEGAPVCNAFRKKSKGLCKTCLEKLTDPQYEAYKKWWEANYKTFNSSDESFAKDVDDDDDYNEGATSAPSMGPPAQKKSKQDIHIPDDKKEDRGKGEGSGGGAGTPLMGEIRGMPTAQILTEMTVMLSVLQERLASPNYQ